MARDSAPARKLAIHNATRLSRIFPLVQRLSAGRELASPDPASLLTPLVQREDPFEFDLGFTFRPDDGFALEVGYNPHLALTSEVHGRVETLFAALNWKTSRLLDFLDLIPFYLPVLTLGMEWRPHDSVKLSVLMEDLHTHLDDEERHKLLSGCAAVFNLPVADLHDLFDTPALTMAAADFHRGGIQGVRLFTLVKRPDLAAVIARITGRNDPARRRLEAFATALPVHKKGEMLLCYRKYDPRGLPMAAKLYYTPPRPQAAHALAQRLLSRFAPKAHPNREALQVTLAACQEAELSCDPVCLSMAVGLGPAADSYLALYYALGGIPHEHIA